VTARPSVILVGGFSEIIELCAAAGIEVVGIIDRQLSTGAEQLPLLGGDDDAAGVLERHPGVPVHITPDPPAIRQRLAARYPELGAEHATLVHPSAIVSPSATLGAGCVIQAGASISSFARLGRCVKVNTRATITHDVTIDDYATIAPCAVLLGRSRIGAAAYVGANSTILPGVAIGRGATVGAGTTITRDVPDGATFVGSPGRPV
jgi:sugar O-acyltransferase (sialic acid O-acetyltransferase NeuD family)